MKEKFSDYEGAVYLNEEGEILFTIDDYELKDSKNGNPMAVFTCKSDKGQTTIYHTITDKTKWSYNNLIKACLHLNTREKIEAFELDYETIGNELIGKQFIGVVEAETYTKEIKKPNADGTFDTVEEERTSYKIKSYKEAV